MRILIYTHTFAPQVGGVETVVMSLASGLAGVTGDDGLASQKVTVATATPRGEFDDQLLPFRVVRQPTLLQLVRLVRSADVIQMAGPSFLPMLIGLILFRPVVVAYYGFQTICPNGQLLYKPTQAPCPGHFTAGNHRECIRCNAQSGVLHSLTMWLLTFPRRWLCSCAKVNVTPTNWLSTVLQLPRTITIHLGLPVDANGKRSCVDSPQPTFAFLGRLVSTKGVHILLQAAHRLNAKGLVFALKIIGDGPERARLEAQTRTLGLADRVAFLGYQPDSALPQLLSDVRTIVMPSLAGETFGLVAGASMMRATVPIVSDIGALAEVVGDTGLKFPPGDDAALAGCLEGVLQSDDFAATGGGRARERAMAQFTESRMVAEHLALYRDLTCRDDKRKVRDRKV